jgi:hypothetical protein
MCCVLTVLLLIGPRAALIIWWIFNPGIFSSAFNNIILPILGVIFFPFTTLLYLLTWTFFGGVSGLAWIIVALGILLDISSYSGGGYYNRGRFARY